MESPLRPPHPSFNVSAYLQPDVLTSYEFSKTYRRHDHLLPEVKLMFAVLTNAIECWQKYSSARTRRCIKIFKEAEEWIFTAESQRIYSFEHVCQVLELDPSYLRKGLMRWFDASQKCPPVGPRRRIREPLRLQRRLRESRISM